ncbi:MAG: FG-GAP repeat protein, partial [Nitrospirota bacterium]|nr:FG-GAP repeat protein [Nitrospirota bacterium]
MGRMEQRRREISRMVQCGALAMGLCLLTMWGAMPLAWAVETRLVPSVTKPGAQFGQALAARGDLLVVGASDAGTNQAKAGAAYVFRFDPAAGTWVEEARLVSPNPIGDGYFGAAVATDGTRVVVGAPGEERAYVFGQDVGGVWSPAAALPPPTSFFTNSGFGRAVAVSGTQVAVGANTCIDCLNGQAGTGAVVMYRQSDAGWVQGQRLSAEGGGSVPTLLGLSVALDGSTLLAGDAFAEPESPTRGALLVWEYTPSTAGSWVQRPNLSAPDGEPGDHFGLSVALDGNTAVVASPTHADGGFSYTGAVYVFTRSAGAWLPLPAELRPLGASDLPRPPVGPVALSGSRLLVGAPDQNALEGGAYVFTRSATGVWPLGATPVAHSAVRASRFGYAVAVTADHLVVGALDEDRSRGAVYANSPAAAADGGGGTGTGGGGGIGGGGTGGVGGVGGVGGTGSGNPS